MSEDSSEIVPSSGQTPALPSVPQGIQRRAIQSTPATAPVQSVSGVLSDIGDNTVTSRAEQILGTSDEDMVWQERPSLILLIPRFLKYAAIMAVVMFLCSVADRYFGPSLQHVAETQGTRLSSTLREHDTRISRAKRNAARQKAKAAQAQAEADKKQSDTDNATDSGTDDDTVPVHHQARILVGFQWIVGVVLFAMWVIWLLRLLTTKYSASSQRLIVDEGLLHSVNHPWELHQLGDAVIVKPLIPRWFGVGNLVITKPQIVLLGLRNAEYVRDLIRQGGQQEAQRVDKIRFR